MSSCRVVGSPTAEPFSQLSLRLAVRDSFVSLDLLHGGLDVSEQLDLFNQLFIVDNVENNRG